MGEVGLRPGFYITGHGTAAVALGGMAKVPVDKCVESVARAAKHYEPVRARDCQSVAFSVVRALLSMDEAMEACRLP